MKSKKCEREARKIGGKEERRKENTVQEGKVLERNHKGERREWREGVKKQ